MENNNEIIINKHMYFDANYRRFYLTSKAAEIIYR